MPPLPAGHPISFMSALFLLLSAAIVAGDQIFKNWIVNNIALGGEMPVLPGVIHFTYLRNTGAAFSMFEGLRWPLVVIACVCCGAILVYLFLAKTNPWNKVGLSMVLGGAISNLIDRVRFGYVVDMFEVEFVDYAVFNIADVCITCGGILFCIVFIFFTKEAPRAKPRRRDSAFPETGKLVTEEPETEWTETKILEAYDLERMLDTDLPAEAAEPDTAGEDQSDT